MGVYRVEACPNNRAGCINKECKDKGTKITKGELRFAVQVTIKDHQSWQYKHWGCVTPKQIENLIESSGGDTDMVDGYDELPDEYQEKINYALENHHVHDDDWNGDVEANRDGRSGMRLTKAELKKKAKEADENDDGEEKPKQKRGKKAKANEDEDDEDEAPAQKGKAPKAAKKNASEAEDAPAPKKRGRPSKKEAEAENDETPAPKKSRSARGKKVEYKEADEDEDEDEDDAPPKKKAKAKAKAKAKKAAVDSEDEAEPEPEPEEDDAVKDEEDEEVTKPKRGKKAAANGTAKAPQKRGRKKAVADEN